MIHEIVTASRTVRSFDETKPVSCETLEKLIDTARLSPSAKNAQPLRYILINEKETVETLVSMTKYAAALPELHLPPVGHHPTAFIAVLTDTEVSAVNGRFTMFDAGLSCQSLMLRAHEEGLGGVILASFEAERVKTVLDIGERYEPLVLIALGVPDEEVRLCEVGDDGKTEYYRDENDVHFVPKRKLGDVIIK